MSGALPYALTWQFFMFQWEFVDVQNERRVLCSLETQVLITKQKQ